MDDDDTSKAGRQLLRALGRRRLREIRAHVEQDLRKHGLDLDDLVDLMRNRPEPTWRRRRRTTKPKLSGGRDDHSTDDARANNYSPKENAVG